LTDHVKHTRNNKAHDKVRKKLEVNTYLGSPSAEIRASVREKLNQEPQFDELPGVAPAGHGTQIAAMAREFCKLRGLDMISDENQLFVSAKQLHILSYWAQLTMVQLRNMCCSRGVKSYGNEALDNARLLMSL